MFTQGGVDTLTEQYPHASLGVFIVFTSSLCAFGTGTVLLSIGPPDNSKAAYAD